MKGENNQKNHKHTETKTRHVKKKTEILNMLKTKTLDMLKTKNLNILKSKQTKTSLLFETQARKK